MRVCTGPLGDGRDMLRASQMGARRAQTRCAPPPPTAVAAAAAVATGVPGVPGDTWLAAGVHDQRQPDRGRAHASSRTRLQQDDRLSTAVVYVVFKCASFIHPVGS